MAHLVKLLWHADTAPELAQELIQEQLDLPAIEGYIEETTPVKYTAHLTGLRFTKFY